MKNFLRTVIFLGILAAIIIPLEYCFVPYSAQDTNQTATYYEIPDNSIDVLIVGGSMTMVSLSPTRIFENTGITAYNRGSSRQLPELSYLNVKEAMKNQNIKLVISNASTLANKTDVDEDEPFVRRGMDYRRLSLDKIVIAQKLVSMSEWQNLGTYIFPLTRYHDNWELAAETYRTKKEKAAYDYMHGQYPVYKHLYLETQKIKPVDESFELVDRAVEYQTKIAELCEKNGCQMLLIEMPDSRWTTAKHDAIQELADSLDVKFIDFNTDDLIEKCNISWQEDFYEGHHLNVRGSIKATDYLCDVLRNEYNLKASDVPDTVKKQFREDYALFVKDMESKKYKEVNED